MNVVDPYFLEEIRLKILKEISYVSGCFGKGSLSAGEDYISHKKAIQLMLIMKVNGFI